MAIKLFGFTLGNKDIVREENPEQASFALPTEALDDGAVTITQNAHYGTYVDLEGSVRNELELITRYREMANHPECDNAISEIVDEAITSDPTGKAVEIVWGIGKVRFRRTPLEQRKTVENFRHLVRSTWSREKIGRAELRGAFRTHRSYILAYYHLHKAQAEAKGLCVDEITN